MKYQAHVLLFFIAMFAGYSQNKQNSVYTPIETIVTDLNNDKASDTLLLYQKPAEGDLGLFTKINVSLGGHGRKTFQAKDVWNVVDSDFKKKNNNDIISENVFIHKESNTAYIFLFGFLYGTGREEIAIIRVKGNKAELYFHNELAEPIFLTDLDGDGHKELICRYTPEIYSYDESIKAEIGVYSPFMVYKLDNEFILDKKLTQKYNTDYYIWEGFKYDNSIKVVYPQSKKPYKQ